MTRSNAPPSPSLNKILLRALLRLRHDKPSWHNRSEEHVLWLDFKRGDQRDSQNNSNYFVLELFLESDHGETDACVLFRGILRFLCQFGVIVRLVNRVKDPIFATVSDAGLEISTMDRHFVASASGNRYGKFDSNDFGHSKSEMRWYVPRGFFFC